MPDHARAGNVSSPASPVSPASPASPTSPDVAAIAATLAGFDRRYLAFGLPIVAACVLALAWHWSLPGAAGSGLPFGQAVAVLAAAALLLNLPSFVLQRRSLRAQLRRGARLRALPYALRFYAINLALAVALSVLLWRPLLLLLFFYRLYPIACWLLPCHLLLGLLLGRWLQRRTAPAA